MMPPCATDPTRWCEAKRPDSEAQTMCRTICPMRRECLNRALASPRVMGIWGGLFLPDYEKHPRQHKNRMDSVKHTLDVVSVA